MQSLKATRRERKLTQVALAQASGVRQQTISRIEAGLVRRPAYADVIAICEALAVAPADILEFRCSQ